MGKKKLPRIHYDQWMAIELERCVQLGLRPDEEMVIKTMRQFVHYDQEAGVMQEPITAVQMCNTVEFHRCGKQVFSLGSRLIEMFKKTDLTNITKEDLKLPYDCFFVSIPSGTLQVWGGQRTKFHDVTGIYVRSTTLYDAEPGDFKITIVGAPNERSEDFGDDAVAWICMKTLEVEKHGSVEKAITEVIDKNAAYAPWRDNYGSVFDENAETMAAQTDLHTLARDEDGNQIALEDWRAECANKNKALHGTMGSGGVDHIEVHTPAQLVKLLMQGVDPIRHNAYVGRRKTVGIQEPEKHTPEEVEWLENFQRDLLVSAVRIVVNLICYLDCTNKEVVLDEVSESRRKRKAELISEFHETTSPGKRADKAQRFTRLTSCVNRKVAPSLESKRLSPREHDVRGHFRMQAVGPRWSRRRKTYISFTTKGNPKKPKTKESRLYKSE